MQLGPVQAKRRDLDQHLAWSRSRDGEITDLQSLRRPGRVEHHRFHDRHQVPPREWAGSVVIKCRRSRPNVFDNWVSSPVDAAALRSAARASSKVTLAASSRLSPLSVSSIRLDLPSLGLGSRRHQPPAWTLSTTLLAPPTVMNKASETSRTRQFGVVLTTCMTSNHASGKPCSR